MDLSGMISENLELLVDDWCRHARHDIEPARDLSLDELRDSSRAMFCAMAEDIKMPQSETEQAHKSQGKRPGNSNAITEHATTHAHHRASQNFSLNHLLSEFRAARASVMRLLLPKFGDSGVDLDQIVRFNEAVDEAITVSATVFEQRLDESREMFLGVLGHDLRNPIGALLNAADLVLRNENLSPFAAKAGTLIYSSGRRIRSLLDDLLDFTTTRLGKSLPIRIVEGNMGETVGDVVAELRMRHPAAATGMRPAGTCTGGGTSAGSHRSCRTSAAMPSSTATMPIRSPSGSREKKPGWC